LISAVLFDYGDTLVAHTTSFDIARPIAVRAAYDLLRENGLALSYEEYLERNMAVFKRYSEIEKREDRDIPDLLKYEEIIDKLFPGRPAAWRKRVARRADDAFWKVVVDRYPIRKDAKRTLLKLSSMGLKLGVISNHHNHEVLVKHLRDLGLAQYFTRIMSSAKFGTRKPDPRIFLSCLKSMGVKDPRRAVFVGDSLKHDVGGAQAAGLHTIIIVDEPPVHIPTRAEMKIKPEYTVHALAEIPGIVSSL
jgi:HAD superfamily hydrolase (TIGR01509 family)